MVHLGGKDHRTDSRTAYRTRLDAPIDKRETINN